MFISRPSSTLSGSGSLRETLVAQQRRLTNRIGGEKGREGRGFYYIHAKSYVPICELPSERSILSKANTCFIVQK